MMIGRTMFGGLAAILLAGPVAAAAPAGMADPLACMEASYSEAQSAEIATLTANYRSAGDPENSQWSTRIGEVVLPVVDLCSGEQGWSESALYYGTLFEMGRLSEIAYRQSGSLTPEQIRLMDEALARRERPELWSLMERAVVAGLEGGDPDFSEQELFMMGSFVVSAGIGSDEEAGEKVGELMGMMALVRYARREFDALQIQE